jgi:hypothetical protein
MHKLFWPNFFLSQTLKMLMRIKHAKCDKNKMSYCNVQGFIEVKSLKIENH